MIWHDDEANNFAAILITIIIQAVNYWNNESWTGEYCEAIVYNAGNVVNRALDAISLLHEYCVTRLRLKAQIVQNNLNAVYSRIRHISRR